MTSITDRRNFDFRARLADAVQKWLLQEPNDRISEDDQLRVVCDRLVPLLSEELEGPGGWESVQVGGRDQSLHGE